MNTGGVAMACQAGGDIASLLASVLVTNRSAFTSPGKPYVADGRANIVSIIGLAPFKAMATDGPRMFQRSPTSCVRNPPVSSATGAMRFNRLRMERARQPYDMALRRPPPMASPSAHGGCNRRAGTPRVDTLDVPRVDGLP